MTTTAMIEAGRRLSVDGLIEIARIADDEPEEAQARADQNPQRPYARRPGHWMMRWSRLHGDMQGRTIKGSRLSASNSFRN